MEGFPQIWTENEGIPILGPEMCEYSSSLARNLRARVLVGPSRRNKPVCDRVR